MFQTTKSVYKHWITRIRMNFHYLKVCQFFNQYLTNVALFLVITHHLILIVQLFYLIRFPHLIPELKCVCNGFVFFFFFFF